MSMRNWLGAVVGAALLAPAAAEPATMQSGTIGNWLIGAYSDDATGQFHHCAMSASYRSGIFMVFSVNREMQWALGFANPAWQLTKGTKYQLGMSIDGRTPFLEQATAINATQVEIPLPPNAYLFERFRHGLQLRVDAVGQSFFFNLNSTSRGLADLLVCAQRYSGRG